MKKSYNGKELSKQEFIEDQHALLLQHKTSIEKIGESLKLTKEQIEFAKVYANTSGDGKEAAKQAYGIEEDFQAVNQSYRLLQNIPLLTLISILTYQNGFSPEYLDMQLLQLVNQNAHLPTKLGAIKHANELNGRMNNNELKVTANFNFDNFSIDDLQKFIELGEKAKK